MAVESSQNRPFVADFVRDTIEDEAVDRIRAGVMAARARGPRQSLGRPLFAVATFALILAVVGVVWLLAAGRSSVEGGVAAGPLFVRGAGLLTKLRAIDSTSEPMRSELTDGSMIELSGGAVIEARENSGHRVALDLGLGQARFDVRPGGPRRWSIEAGFVTVDVLGTAFTVDRGSDVVTVAVERGQVRLSSEYLDGGQRELHSGERIEVRRAEAQASFGAMSADDEALEEAIDGGPDVADGAASPRASWRRLAREGDFSEAYGVLGRDGLDREARRADSLDQLMTLADIARFSGHPRDAVGPLEEVIERYPSDTRAAVAAFTLGRLEGDVLHRHGRAARAFRRCLQLRTPAALREDAMARLAHSLARSGDYDGARSAARAYLRAHPSGRRAEELRRWVED